MQLRRQGLTIVLVLLLAAPVGRAVAEEPVCDAQARTTAVALNYCRASFHRIRRCPSKRVLMEEQDKILNNLNLNQIADEEVVKLYAAVLDEIAQVQIAEKDREFIRDTFRRAALRRLTETGFQLGAQAVTTQYVSMVRTGVNSWWDYRDMVFHRDNDSWRIEKLRMEALVAKSSCFLDTFWRLARKRSIQDRWLIRNSDLDELERAMREPELDVRLRVLKRMENFMDCYPPYWYYVARTQQALGQLFAAAETYQKLVAMGDGHFRKDEMLASGYANLSAIQDYLNQPSALPNARESLRRSLEVWEVNVLCSRVLERHNHIDEAEDAILRNLDSGLEQDQSRFALLGLYYRAGKSEKLAAALENAEVVRSLPADALVSFASIIEPDKLPVPVAAALVESFSAQFETYFGGRDLVLHASRNWNLEKAQISAVQGDAKFGNARLNVANGLYEVHLKRLADKSDSQLARSEAEPIIVTIQYGELPMLTLTLQNVSGAPTATTTGTANAANVLVSVLKFRRNGYQLTSAAVADKPVLLRSASIRTAPTENVATDESRSTPEKSDTPAAPAQPSDLEAPTTLPLQKAF